jgi:glycerol-3-phosphate dehydrogenase
MTGRFDVVVIGAGIQGAGVAQAAAAAGYSVRVLEKTGIAAATSCRSSKLIHGGLRYLETGQVRLVRESLREREILLRIAPQLVKRVPFHLPVYKNTSRSRLKIRAGLALYSLLGGFRRESRFDTVPRADWESLDGLDTAGLKAVFRYHDAQTDDARLTRAVLRSAQKLGAELLCPAEFLGGERSGDGWHVRYRGAQGKTECTCHALVNAAGPWVKLVLTRITPAVPLPDIELVQGSHVVVDGTLHRGVYYTEAEDRRAVFVMPWRGGLTLIGTTETPYSGDPAQAAPRREEIDYLLRTYRRYFPHRDADVRDRFAGLRVLPKSPVNTFGRSRETLYVTDNEPKPRLVSVVGGKLTGYRAAAEKVVALLAPALPARARRGDTGRLQLDE